MHKIQKFQFGKKNIPVIRDNKYGKNWPIVYILEDGKEAYVGESISAYKRASQHLENSERAKLDNMFLIADDEYNKSATLDTEALLIRYIAGDGKYILQNSNSGLQESDYYDRERYRAKFELVWKELIELGVVSNDFNVIENRSLFKYSPYKALTADQKTVVESVLNEVKLQESSAHLITGEPGTGKTIVATYLMKAIIQKSWAKDMLIGLVIPMVSLRKTLKKVFKQVKGLSSDMVIGPNEVVNNKYDILIVDEAHRLQRRVNLTNFRAFDIANQRLGFNKYSGTQLDWVMKSAKHRILFYDKQQSVRPVDIRPENIDRYQFTKYKLESQMRVKGGNDYIEYIQNILNSRQFDKKTFPDYEFILFNRLEPMLNAIKKNDKSIGLSRVVAGYAWEWKTKGKSYIDYDFELEGIKLKWNSADIDWVNSQDAIKEVGCIHTIQGYDLNYTGVIVGPELSYDKTTRKLVIDKRKYLDFNGKRAITDINELESYIRNIYKTLMTRGILGTYLYVVDPELREYFRKFVTLRE